MTRDTQILLDTVRAQLSPLLAAGVDLQFDRERGIEAYVGDGDPINLSNVFQMLAGLMSDKKVWVDATAIGINVCDDEGDVVSSTADSVGAMPDIVAKYLPGSVKIAS